MVRTTVTMVYHTQWGGKGLYCPMGDMSCFPDVVVKATDTVEIPFKEIDTFIENITFGTYEDAASQLSERLHERYGGRYGGKIEVILGKDPFYVISVTEDKYPE